jgi:hypothetical protein
MSTGETGAGQPWPGDGEEAHASRVFVDHDDATPVDEDLLNDVRQAASAMRAEETGSAEHQDPSAAQVGIVRAPLRMAFLSGERSFKRAGFAVLAVGALGVAGLAAIKTTQESGGTSGGRPSVESSTTFLPTSTKRLQVTSVPSSSRETSTTLPETSTTISKPEEDDRADTSTTAASTPKTRATSTSSAPPSRPASSAPAPTPVRPAPKPTPTAAPPPLPPPKPQPTPAPTQPGVTRH